MKALAKCDCKYGAPMGRRERHDHNNSVPVKLHLGMVTLTQGYDAGGAYWGNHIPVSFTRADGLRIRVTPSLYWYYSDCGLVNGFLDAIGREQAKEQIRLDYPLATFYR